MAEQATAEVEQDAQPEAAETPEKKVEVPAVPVARFGLEPEFNTIWRVNVTIDTTPKDTLKEGFWRHIARNLRVGDTIRVVPDNWAWEQILHVAGQGKVWAHVVEKELYDLRTTKHEIHVPAIYKVEFAGSHHKWRVLREGVMLRDGFETEALARRYAANHETAVERSPIKD